MNEELRKFAQSQLDSLEPGATFDVKTLMGEKWNSIADKQGFGRAFKEAANSGSLLRVKHDHLANSPRRDIYCRT